MNNAMSFNVRVRSNQLPQIGIAAVRVGIYKNDSAAVAKSKLKGHARLADTNLKRRKIKRRSQTITLKKLAAILDGEYGFITKAADNPNTAYMREFCAELHEYFNGEIGAQRIKNLALAIVRNPIIEGHYGSNAESTIQRKGFNKPLIDTGTLFNAIEATIEYV